MAIFNTGRSFYDPTDWSGGDFTTTPVHDWTAELNKQGYFGNWLGRQGLLGSNNESDVARSMYNRLDQGFQAGLFNNPEDTWVNYLNRHQYNMRDILASMDPGSRGISPYQFVGGSRWLPRSG
jgi:hypothetical protein